MSRNSYRISGPLLLLCWLVPSLYVRPAWAAPPAPKFEKVLVADKLEDGYWVQAVDVNGDSKPDLVTSGLAIGEVAWFENPSWKKRVITKLSKPVALDHADIDGDGSIDLVISHNYGDCMFNCKPEDGKISWLQNPGKFDEEKPWAVHFVGNLMAAHRLQFGYFTQDRTLELLALPVVGPGGVHAPVRVTLYRVPENVRTAKEWDGSLVDNSSLRIIHGVIVKKFWSHSGSALDAVLLASEEGISRLHFGQDGKWHKEHLGSGVLNQVRFKGSGNVDVGGLGDDRFSYIPAVEPFHGNTVAVYTKRDDSSLTSITWKRTVLDVFGPPNENGEGAGHHVRTADFDGDGDDEFIVAERGPMPWQGVFYYKAVDAKNGKFLKIRVSNASAARIAIADFDGDGRLDFATTGYYTPGYFLADNPQVLVFLNRFGKAAIQTRK